MRVLSQGGGKGFPIDFACPTRGQNEVWKVGLVGEFGEEKTKILAGVGGGRMGNERGGRLGCYFWLRLTRFSHRVGTKELAQSNKEADWKKRKWLGVHEIPMVFQTSRQKSRREV